MEFGVIIVTYNRKNLLSECLNCVFEQTVPFSRVIVVDNHSTDGTKEYLDTISANHDSLCVFHLKENLGGAGGFSFGLAQTLDSSCDWILIIDDDAMIEKNYIKKLSAAIQNTNYLACSGTVMSNGVVDRTHRRRIKNPILMLLEPVGIFEYHRDTFEYDISTFCGLCIKTSLIRKIGLPKTDYFIWFDDTEYCLRFHKYSRILNVNAAVLNHKTAPISSSIPICWKHYYGFRNSIDIGKTYSTCPAVYSIYIWANHIAHILIDSFFVLLGNRREERNYRIQIYKDVLRGFWDKPSGKDIRYLPGSGPQ